MVPNSAMVSTVSADPSPLVTARSVVSHLPPQVAENFLFMVAVSLFQTCEKLGTKICIFNVRQ